MTANILALRVSRRALTGAALRDDTLVLSDGRHLTSNQSRVFGSALKYVARLLEQVQPHIVFLYTPTTASDGTTARLRALIEQQLSSRGISVQPVTSADLLTAYGHPRLRRMDDLIQVVESFWPPLTDIRSRTRSAIVTAVGVALYADTLQALPQAP